MIVVSDTSCISDLLLAGQPDLLQKIYTEIIIPPAVHNQILKLETNGRDLSDFKLRKWILIKQDFPGNISSLPPKNIDRGEAEVLDLAVYLKADRPLIVERKGSQLAKQLKIATIGWLGIFKIAKEKNLISTIKIILDQLIENIYWLSNQLYNLVLKSVNEQ